MGVGGCATPPPTPGTVIRDSLRSPPGVAALLGTLVAASWILHTLFRDIGKDQEQQRARRRSSLPLTGRWLQYFLAVVLTLAATPFILAALFALSLMAWLLLHGIVYRT
jgi:hypothetical protein